MSGDVDGQGATRPGVPAGSRSAIPGELIGAAIGFGAAAAILGGLSIALSADLASVGVGVGIASAAFAVVAGMTVSVHAWRIRQRTSVPGFAILSTGTRRGYLMLGAACLWLGVMAARRVSAPPDILRAVDGAGATVLAAMAGACGGIAALVTAAATPEVRRDRGRRDLAAGLVVAVVCSVTVAGTARQFYSAYGAWSPAVAEQVLVPDLPVSVGAVAYRTRLAESPDALLKAGAGFVIKTGSRLIAYGGRSGKVRWQADFSQIGVKDLDLSDISQGKVAGTDVLRIRVGAVLFSLDEITGRIVKTEHVNDDSNGPSALKGFREELRDLRFGDGGTVTARQSLKGPRVIRLDYRADLEEKPKRTEIQVVDAGFARPNLERIGGHVVVVASPANLYEVDPVAGNVVGAHTNPCAPDGETRLYSVPGAFVVWCRHFEATAISHDEIVGLVPRTR
jgi:hypothetical protein